MSLDATGPITPEHVRWAYRLFLDREPESDDAVRAHMSAPSVEAMHRGFLSSSEFRSKLAVQVRPLPIDVPATHIDVDTDPETPNALLVHVQRCWEHMGRERPHHSVLTDPNFLPASFVANEEGFWASGEHDAMLLDRVLARHGVTHLADLTCIDFGCGVGRVTGPLSRRFAKVHAYDISIPHIEIAKTRAGNAEFHLLRDLPVQFAEADVFYSRIVLQHNPPPIIAMLIRGALACLRQGGTAVFQVPTYELGYRFSIKDYLAGVGRAPLDLEMHRLPQHEIFRLAEEARCRVLEVREEDSTGRFGHDVSNLFVIRR